MITLHKNPEDTFENVYEFAPPLDDWDGLLLLGLRYWPKDSDKQADLLRVCLPRFMAEKKQHYPEVYASHDYWNYLDRVATALGGWEAIADASRYSDIKASIARMTKNATWVGIALTLIQQFHAQGFPQELLSINRVAYLLDEYGEYLLKTSIRRDSFLKAWARFKPVAHLWAAHLAATDWWAEGGPSEPPGDLEQRSIWHQGIMLDELLLAQAFYEFGTTFMPHRGNEPLLDPGTAICIKAEVEGPPFTLPIFPEVIRRALEVYPKTKSH